MIFDEMGEMSYRLAQIVRFHRQRRGMTQLQLAMVAGIDYKHLQNIESLTYRKDPHLSTLTKLARGLQVPLTELLEEMHVQEPDEAA